MLLALVPVVVLHSAVLLIAGAFTSVPRWVNIPLLAIDIAIFSVLYKLLRLRYLDAQRERRFARLSAGRAGGSGAAARRPPAGRTRRAQPRGLSGASSSEGSGRSPSTKPSPRFSPLKPRRSSLAISRSPSMRAGCPGREVRDQGRDAVAQLQREMGRGGAHQLAHVLDGHLAGALLALPRAGGPRPRSFWL